MTSDKVPGLLILLQRLGDLSASHGYTWHADYIRETADSFRLSEEAGWDHLASIQFWGGAGSIDDVHFGPDEVEWHRQNNRPVPAHLSDLNVSGYAADNREYITLLAGIARAMAECPLTSERERWVERARWMGGVFEKWVKERLV